MIKLKGLNEKEIKNVKVFGLQGGEKQIQKVKVFANGIVKTIWENWVPWSFTHRQPSSGYGDFSNYESWSYPIPSGKAISYVYCNAMAYNHTPNYGAETTAVILYNGTQVARGSTHGVDGGGEANSYASYTFNQPVTSGTITIVSQGTGFKRAVYGEFSGLQKGN